MDDGEFDRGKDSAQQRDATNLPLACLPTAYGRFLPVLTVSNVSVATGGGYRQHGLVLTSLFPQRMARWMDQAGSQRNASSCASVQVKRDTGIPVDNVMNIIDGIPTAEELSRASRTARRFDGGRARKLVMTGYLK